MTGRLAGRVIVVTGSSGIAAASVERFLAEGASPFVIARTAETCTSLARTLDGLGHRLRYAVTDVADEAGVRRAVDECVAAYGRIDGAFTVAGHSGRSFGDGPVHEATAEAWTAVFNSNAMGTFLVWRSVLQVMLQSTPHSSGERGALLAMSSVLAGSPSPVHFPTHLYAASKGAVEALVRTSAAYYAPMGVRVNAVAPALVRTPMTDRAAADAALNDYVQWKQPLSGGWMQTEDVVAAAVYLLSGESRHVTGQTLLVDGGWALTESSP